MTLTLFPLLYATLELPKRIINDAIGAESGTVVIFGVGLSQTAFLFILCGLFLLAVLAHGLMKMRINTMKGVLSERLLRRLRYTLIARLLRFPAPYFERTSQGELVSMVTSEAEPMGGLMGDAIAQPVLQAGQMLTILGFLFAQSVAFGIAACAMIPLQAWLIPKLQRQINLLNKKRIVEVRALAADIGENAGGAATLRVHGGWRYRMAQTSERLSVLFAIRFEIFQKKFFMKFLNNFIGQITPFFFYAIGGYLTIKGDITLGALVAALAAYKDLSSPWKELLAYYNQHQDMSLRWAMLVQRFAPAGMIDDKLFDSSNDDIPRLSGDVVLTDVTVRDEDGHTVLDDISVTIPAGKRIAITAKGDEDRRALSELLTREILPAKGSVVVAGHDLAQLHQSTICARIGHASSKPVLFSGSFEHNLLMPMRPKPLGTAHQTESALESLRAGNTADTTTQDWLHYTAADLKDRDELNDWWLQLIAGMGSADALIHRAIGLRLDDPKHAKLAQAIVEIRPDIARAVISAGLETQIWPLDTEKYNPALTVLDNLLFATPRGQLTAAGLAEKSEFLRLLKDLKLEESLLQLSIDIVKMIRQIFGIDGVNHPLFRRMGLDPNDYEIAVSLISVDRQKKALSDLQTAQLLIVPFSVSAEAIGITFPDEITGKVLELRKQHGKALLAAMPDLFVPITATGPVAGFSILENAIFGKVAPSAGRKGEEVQRVVIDTLRGAGLDRDILLLMLDTPVGLGGANLPARVAEPLALSRAAIKRPDILVLETAMQSHDIASRVRMYRNLHRLLPDTTLISLAPSFEGIDGFDMYLEMDKGRISRETTATTPEADTPMSADQSEKIRTLEASDVFGTLSRKQLGMLAFAARWHRASAGEYVFRKDDDPSSGAYLITDGTADLLMPQDDGDDTLVSQIGPGTLVGELGLIRNVPRALDMRAATDLKSLRIGGEAFLSVLENDAATTFKILQVIAGYVGK
ncbi:ABC transporter transmembrane domain-containing protein [Sulfitobacter sp. S190]|uniref:ABC transporter transmembrane domain-containing protein n=1 Tax=Sulfitobacter sp. S190 TaxID=2867022 RepID=UPI00220A497F|nr:ABC transporter transmembrane domain-containing protein [Sulfitobacter sp. S190]UWR24159.1 cyclic nucleotide-binding domain-containing protein [Sulfitobacter sp. S190]